MSKWRLEFEKGAEKRIWKLPHDLRERILVGIYVLKNDPYGARNLDVKPLRGRNEWRLRVGGWRVVYRVEKESVTVVIVSVDTRGDVYK